MEDNKTRSLFTREITSMPEKGNQVRCMGCMEEFSAEFEVCPECGYVVGTASKMPYALKPGLLLAEKYLLGKVIGQGGFGITYIGWDVSKKRKVAIKEFFPNALSTRTEGATVVSCYNDKAERYFNEGIRKMMDEGARLSKFSEHPNIVNVYDTFEQNKTAYIVMEYLDGKSLKEYAAEKGGRLEPREAINLMIPVIGALEEMHKENMIHRDIAPDNIYICEDGRIKLLDFGSARIAVQDAEKSLSVMVKPGYAPKEQYASRSKQGPWTDVYSVCATLYRLVTGESPVESIEREVTPLKTFEELDVECTNGLESLLFMGLEPEPEDRIRTASELKALLLEVLADDESEDSSYKREDEEYQNNDKKFARIGVVIIVAVLVAIIGFIWYAIYSSDRQGYNDYNEEYNDYDDVYVDQSDTLLEYGENIMYYGYGGIVKYTFRAETSGEYIFESDNYSDGNGSDFWAQLWWCGVKQDENDDYDGRDFHVSKYMYEGEVVTLVVSSVSGDAQNIKINVSRTQKLLPGRNMMYYGSSNIKRYTFRAKTSGTYVFESDNYSDGSGSDMKAELWSNGVYLEGNDDYYDRDFYISRYLYAGQTVTLVVTSYSSDCAYANIIVSRLNNLSMGSNIMYYGSSNIKRYTFRAKTSGTYVFESDNYSDGSGSDMKAELWSGGWYYNGNDDYDDRDFHISQYLYAGQTVTLVVTSLSEETPYAKINISRSDTLTDGFNVMYYGSANIMRYNFYVENSDWYYLESCNNYYGYGDDLKVELWSNGVYLEGNDDYYDRDFHISRYLYAGQTVTLVVTSLSEETPYAFIRIS